jgi:hypothetical protein
MMLRPSEAESKERGSGGVFIPGNPARLSLHHTALRCIRVEGTVFLAPDCSMRKMATASPATSRFPLAVKQLLKQALALRDRYLKRKILLHGLWTATGRLEASSTVCWRQRNAMRRISAWQTNTDEVATDITK